MKMVLLDTGILLRLLNADDPLHGPVRSAASPCAAKGVHSARRFKTWRSSGMSALGQQWLGEDWAST